MAGALKKTMIYLGLADGDEYDEQPRAAEIEEEQAGRVEPAQRRPLQQRRVEVGSEIEVGRRRGHLNQFHSGSVARARPGAD